MSCFGGSKKNQAVYRKIVILGDGAAGKTSLLNVFTRGFFPAVYEPTVFENYIHDIFIDGRAVELSLWDTAGQEEFDRLRSLSYSDTHVIMCCFAVDSRDSLENVQAKWVGEIAEHCDGVKLVLVALKCDLREQDALSPVNPTGGLDGGPGSRAGGGSSGVGAGSGRGGKAMITYEEGLAVAKRIRAVRYLECSAKHNRGVTEAFTEAARTALLAKPAGGNNALGTAGNGNAAGSSGRSGSGSGHSNGKGRRSDRKCAIM